jgi:hypothetical protein
MTDITKYRNISVTHAVYANLIKISKTMTRVPGVKVSISKTVETLAEQEVQLMNGKEKKKDK